MPYNTLIHTDTTMTDKEKFMVEWMIKHPEDNEIDAFDAWKLEVKFINTFQDWDNQDAL